MEVLYFLCVPETFAGQMTYSLRYAKPRYFDIICDIWHTSKRQVRISIRWSVTPTRTGSVSCDHSQLYCKETLPPSTSWNIRWTKQYLEARQTDVVDSSNSSTFCEEIKTELEGWLATCGWSVGFIVRLTGHVRRLYHKDRCVTAKPSN